MHIALPANLAGKQLAGRYQLDRLIGEGASAWVFAARDLLLEREVAVKVLKPRPLAEDASQRRRFVAEGRTLAKLVHPHVVLVYDVGETGEGLGYLVMELSEAGTLEAELCRRGSLLAGETLQLLLPVLGALACAHERGIVHRDLKPANIVLVREGPATRAKLLDFGIAKLRDTGTDSASGTPSYMAPEQARGERSTPAVDVWALGVVFFECLSGRLPFAAASSVDGLMKPVRERAPLFAEACPGLGVHLALALDRALESDAERRYPDMRSFAHALASASVQDGTKLPVRPEPLGLPDFEEWLANTDVNDTRPLAAAERAAIAVGPVRPITRRATRYHGALLAVVIALAAALGLAMQTREPAARVAERDRAPRTPTVGRVSSPAASLTAPPPTGLDPVPSLAVQAESARALAAPEPTKPAVPRRRPRNRSPESATQTNDVERAPLGPTSRQFAVIKTWDW